MESRGRSSRKQQDGDSQKMQDTEPDHFVPHEQVEKKGNSHRNSRQNQAAAGVAVGQIAGNAADKDEQPGKKGLNRPEKLEKRAPERRRRRSSPAYRTHGKTPEDQVESTNLIEKMDPAAKNRGVDPRRVSSFCGMKTAADRWFRVKRRQNHILS